jgi:hypothetical protein
VDRILRAAITAVGAVAVVIGIASALQQPWAVALWPFQHLEIRLGMLFVGSIWVAGGTAALWFGVSGDLRASGGGALAGVVIFAGIGGYLLSRPGQTAAFGAGGALCLAVSLAFVAEIFFTRRYAYLDERPMPALVRWSFVVFAVVLLLAGLALTLEAPNVFPWPLAADSSVMYGWIFFGNAAFFLFAIFSPKISNVYGPLLAFLAYDLVLIVPFLGHFAAVRRDLLPNLTFYVAVLLYSGALAVYYVFINRRSRLWWRPSTLPQ